VDNQEDRKVIQDFTRFGGDDYGFPELNNKFARN